MKREFGLDWHRFKLNIRALEGLASRNRNGGR